MRWPNMAVPVALRSRWAAQGAARTASAEEERQLQQALHASLAEAQQREREDELAHHESLQLKEAIRRSIDEQQCVYPPERADTLARTHTCARALANPSA